MIHPANKSCVPVGSKLPTSVPVVLLVSAKRDRLRLSACGSISSSAPSARRERLSRDPTDNLNPLRFSIRAPPLTCPAPYGKGGQPGVGARDLRGTAPNKLPSVAYSLLGHETMWIGNRFFNTEKRATTQWWRTQYSIISSVLGHHETYVPTRAKDRAWSVPSSTSLIALKTECGGSPLCTETCSRYPGGSRAKRKVSLHWMRVAAPVDSSPGSPKRIPRELYSDLMSTQMLARAQQPRALARFVPDHSMICHS